MNGTADHVTLAAPASHAMEIRKSRFLAEAAPARTIDEATAFIDTVSANDAGHHCWAYRIGDAYRFNDDGEPSGSAGKPILAAIDHQGLDGVVAVVSRWFGGIKLGIGGLIRAYGGTAAECLRTAEHVTIVATTRLTLTCAHADAGLIKARAAAWDIRVLEESFGASRVKLLLAVPDAQIAAFEQLVADITRGKGLLRRT